MKLLICVVAAVALNLVDAVYVQDRENEATLQLGTDDGHELSDSHAEHLPAWNEFKRKFRREYETFEVEVKRFTIFVQNLLFVNEHNKLYQQGKASFEVGINEYADLVSTQPMSRARLNVAVELTVPCSNRPTPSSLRSATDCDSDLESRPPRCYRDGHCGSVHRCTWPTCPPVSIGERRVT